MPRTGKKTTGFLNAIQYSCPCGYEKRCNDERDAKACRTRHMKYCKATTEINNSVDVRYSVRKIGK